MFEPVPSYALFKEKNSRKANKNAIDQLNKFIPRVASYFQKYNIAYENRFQCILDICTSLGTLLDEKGPKIWPEGSKEPTDEFENIFQLLIYALGDCGLLYDSYGVWIGYRSSQNTDDLCDAWEVSEDVYHRLAFAMRNRDYTYRQIYKLRRDLKAHHNQTSWDEQAINYKGTPTKTGMFYLIRQLQNRKIIQDEKTISDAVTNLFSDRLLLPYGPLFLFFALWEPNFSTEMFRERLIQNCSRFPKAKKRPSAKSKQGPKLEPRDLGIMQEDCKRYLQLEAIFQNTPRLLDAPTDILWMEFDPFLILRYLETKISITDEQKSIIANNTLRYYWEPNQDVPSEILDIKINNVPIMDIMRSFFIIWNNQRFKLSESSIIIPRKWKESLRRLYNTGIVQPIDGIPVGGSNREYTDKQYNLIKDALLDEYHTISYSSSQEMFWLITGYTPPYDFSFTETFSNNDNDIFGIPELPDDLYGLCHILLHKLWVKFKFQCESRFQLGCSQELYKSILKEREKFVSKWSEHTLHDFIKQLLITAQSNPLEMKSKLRTYISSFFEISVKGKSYAKDMIYDYLLADCFMLAEMHFYETVFSLLSFMTKTLWPLNENPPNR